MIWQEKHNKPQSPTVPVEQMVRRGVYREDDWKAEVEILEDRSDDEKEDFTLKVVKTLRQSMIYKPTPEGHVFAFFKLKGYAMPGLGHLEII